ncbi:MAG: LacI family DNA-binding transcriptional regulator, partial [Novosphingobium sp.]
MDKTKPRTFRVTSFDVAAEAGVSQSTVSRALAGDPVVSEATRLRVAEAARKLNYFVDNNAARLRTGKTGTLAVVAICRPDEDRKDLNPFTYALLGSICAAASARGFETLVSFQDGPNNLSGRYEEQRKADGLIVIGTTQNGAAWDYYRELAATGMHWVCWG